MSSNAQVSALIEGLDVTVKVRGATLRAVVTREALEAHWQLVEPGSEAMLRVYDLHRKSIEAAILRRCAIVGRQPVVVFPGLSPP